MRKTQFATGEYYHIYNRGVDKRNIFNEETDLKRFFQAMNEFNTPEPIGSIYEKYHNKFHKERLESKTKYHKKLVEFISYCLNPNHFHFILQQVSENGIPKFMHKLATGHTMFFNEKYE